jgi:hypothetical protein
VKRDEFQIRVGEEFACLVLSGCPLRLKEVTDPVKVGKEFWVSTKPPFELNEEWRRQLGGIVSERVGKYSNFVITAKGPGTADRLSYRAEHLLWGIAATVGVARFDSADLVLGNLAEAPVVSGGIRVAVGLQPMFPTYGVWAPQVTLQDLEAAARFEESIEQIVEERDSDLAKRTMPFSPIYFRIVSGFAGFQFGVKQVDLVERLHQFRSSRGIFFSTRKNLGSSRLGVLPVASNCPSWGYGGNVAPAL